jgi:uncharacterized protein YhbP (UPF0306 family)
VNDINQQKVMQVATLRGNQPWICTVYFVTDNGNFYWLSLPERRHSQELEKNKRAAIAVAIKQDIPVIGLQAEGEVRIVTTLEEVERVLAIYVKKYNQGLQFVERFKAGKNRHLLYCLTPSSTKLFDESSPL